MNGWALGQSSTFAAYSSRGNWRGKVVNVSEDGLTFDVELTNGFVLKEKSAPNGESFEENTWVNMQFVNGFLQIAGFSGFSGGE